MRNRSRLIQHCLLAGAGWVASAPDVAAQGTLPTPAQCDEWVARAATDLQAAAVGGILGGCGVTGTRIIARAIGASVQEADQVPFVRIRDASPRSGVIFEAALALAVNPAAIANARVGAMRILATQLMGEGGDLAVPGGVGPASALIVDL
jgi:hypothetical protein